MLVTAALALVGVLAVALLAVAVVRGEATLAVVVAILAVLVLAAVAAWAAAAAIRQAMAADRPLPPAATTIRVTAMIPVTTTPTTPARARAGMEKGKRDAAMEGTSK
jgi:hypothetical protein